MLDRSVAAAASFTLATFATLGALGALGALDVKPAILAGSPSDGAQDSVVMLVFSDLAANSFDICTAALIAPRLVLTARHCVADTDADVACNANGDAVRGGVVHATHDPQKLFVFTGPQRPDLDPKTWKPAGQGMQVLDDGASSLCNHDIALVLLEKPIDGVPLASLRLEGSVDQGEQLLTVGWGVTSTMNEPAQRQQRSGVKVTRVGPDETDPALGPNELTFDESICLGDSGGPIASQETGAVVAVVSRGGNGQSSDSDLTLSCVAATNLGTKVASFGELLNRGFAAAQASPVVEMRAASPPSGSGCAISRTAGRGGAAANARAPSSTSGHGLLAGLAFCAYLHCRRRKPRCRRDRVGYDEERGVG